METKEKKQFKKLSIQERHLMRLEMLKVMKSMLKTSSLALLVLVIVMGLLYVVNPESNSPYGFEKEPIQKTLKAIIINGGNLDIIKHTYNNRDLKGKNFREDLLGIDKDKYYRYDYPLSGILNDLLKKYYIDIEEKKYTRNYNKNVVIKGQIVNQDSLYFHLLNNIISENEKHNPFDKLEENQKYNFETIQQKLDSNYVKIAPDITKIVDEMYNKNQLIAEYLNNSELSLKISIGALIVTILLSMYQIIQNRRSSKIIKSMGKKVFIIKDEISTKNETTNDKNIEA